MIAFLHVTVYIVFKYNIKKETATNCLPCTDLDGYPPIEHAENNPLWRQPKEWVISILRMLREQ